METKLIDAAILETVFEQADDFCACWRLKIQAYEGNEGPWMAGCPVCGQENPPVELLVSSSSTNWSSCLEWLLSSDPILGCTAETV